MWMLFTKANEKIVQKEIQKAPENSGTYLWDLDYGLLNTQANISIRFSLAVYADVDAAEANRMKEIVSAALGLIFYDILLCVHFCIGVFVE